MHFCNGSRVELGDLYECLSQAPNIDSYCQRNFWLGVERTNYIGVPSQVTCPILYDEEDEDGFVTIFQTDRVRWEGHEKVTEVLGVLAEHMRSW
jgi:hypothetical protein